MVLGTPAASTWALLAALGVVVTSAGPLLLTRACSLTPTGQIGAFDYTLVIFAALLGWIFWREWLTAHTLLGVLGIASTGLLIPFARSARTHPRGSFSARALRSVGAKSHRLACGSSPRSQAAGLGKSLA